MGVGHGLLFPIYKRHCVDRPDFLFFVSFFSVRYPATGKTVGAGMTGLLTAVNIIGENIMKRLIA